MPRRAPELALVLPPRGADKSPFHWLVGALVEEILAGRLRPGSRLPSTRALARSYGLARGTVVTAFEELMAQGYVTSSRGSGSYVSRTLPEAVLRPRRRARESNLPAALRAVPSRPVASHPDALHSDALHSDALHSDTLHSDALHSDAAHPPRLSRFARRTRPTPGLSSSPARAFRANSPDLTLFPVALWARLVARRWRRATSELLCGCGSVGYPPLQEAIAAHLVAARGVRCEPEQVLVTSGTQDSLDFAARLLLEPGDRVGLEEPGYVGADRLFEAAGARIVSLPVDAEGVTLPARRARGLRLVYVTPAHQFPTGVTMSLARRLELLAWAKANDAWIFEDDYDSEFRYSGRPLPALQGLDRAGTVLFAGSFSKVLVPSLRLGYLVLPPELLPAAAALRSTLDRHAPVPEQAAVCDFLTEGHFGRHLRRMRELYAERLAILGECVRERLDGLVALSPIEAGLQTMAWLPDAIDEDELARAAARRGLEVTPLERYYRGPASRAGLQLGFAAVDGPEIRRGVDALATAIEEIAKAT